MTAVTGRVAWDDRAPWCGASGRARRPGGWWGSRPRRPGLRGPASKSSRGHAGATPACRPGYGCAGSRRRPRDRSAGEGRSARSPAGRSVRAGAGAWPRPDHTMTPALLPPGAVPGRRSSRRARSPRGSVADACASGSTDHRRQSAASRRSGDGCRQWTK